jgi:hypothetical protein
VTAEYLSARREVSALNAEDSGSSYFASLPRRRVHDSINTASESH